MLQKIAGRQAVAKSTDSATETPKGLVESHASPHTEKYCPRCAETKPAAAFRTRVVDGRRYLQSYCRECLSGHVQAWQGENYGRFRQTQNESRRRHRDRTAAQTQVRYALQAGRLVRGDACDMASPDCDGPIQAHHDDYSRPLDVRWVCRRHHADLDVARRAQERAA